jgi:hypothetical protein
MVLDELKHYIQMNLTFSGALPKLLPDLHIETIIENDAKPYFYRNVYESVIKEYLYIPRHAFNIEKHTRYKYLTLPCDTQRVVWLYEINDTSLFSLGINAPNLSVNLGVSNQPYLQSVVTTVGELGVYKVIIDSFADMLNQLTKHTLKFDFNTYSKQLNILTSMGLNGNGGFGNGQEVCGVVAEVYNSIPDQDLYDSSLFRRYVDAKANIAMGALVSRYDYQLPGSIKLNGADMISRGNEDLTRVFEEIKSTSTNAIIIMTKK